MSADSAGRRTNDAGVEPLILVVDDSTTIRRIIKAALEGAQFRVAEAGDGMQALAACEESLPDLVLLDMDMPVMSGVETVSEMRRRSSTASVPVIFLTARTGADDAVRGLELGAQDYLRKPCEPAEIIARVRVALAVKSRADQLQRDAETSDRLSSTDQLTGLGNRHYLDQYVRRLRSLEPSTTPVAAYIVDIDHFKRVNDTLGHLSGDQVLAVVAQRLHGALGPRDVIARWGGEEFVVLSRSDSASPAELAERLRASVAMDPVELGGSEPLPVTVSVGWASGPLERFEGLLETADAGLYVAKRGGRNRAEPGPVGT